MPSNLFPAQCLTLLHPSSRKPPTPSLHIPTHPPPAHRPNTHLPYTLPLSQEAHDALLDSLCNTVELGHNNSLLLVGPRGSGKTLVRCFGRTAQGRAWQGGRHVELLWGQETTV